MYEIIFSQTAEKQLKKLEDSVQNRIVSVLDRIKIRPFSFVKKLVGHSSYRLRVGDYRVIMEIEADKLVILVVEIGHRSKIYK